MVERSAGVILLWNQKVYIEVRYLTHVWVGKSNNKRKYLENDIYNSYALVVLQLSFLVAWKFLHLVILRVCSTTLVTYCHEDFFVTNLYHLRDS